MRVDFPIPDAPVTPIPGSPLVTSMVRSAKLGVEANPAVMCSARNTLFFVLTVLNLRVCGLVSGVLSTVQRVGWRFFSRPSHRFVFLPITLGG